jgi:hypothetical protein
MVTAILDANMIILAAFRSKSSSGSVLEAHSVGNFQQQKPCEFRQQLNIVACRSLEVARSSRSSPEYVEYRQYKEHKPAGFPSG